MKVTVCFGAVRIVVPCGTGELLVRDLIHEATRRYRKAIGKDPDSWVVVHHLQTQSGILDPDDRLSDVADDREQILASFEDSGPDPGVQQGGGDGASGSSSVGTGSPDIFRDPTNSEAATGSGSTTTPHIEVTSTTAGPYSGLGLQVRRSSDPNLVQTLKTQSSDATKRWSAAAPVCRAESPDRLLDKVNYLSPQWEVEDDEQQLSPNPPQTFARSGRLSMQFLGDGSGYKWMEAADKAASQPYSSKSLPREAGKRKEPLGQAYESIREKDGEMLLIINEHGGPLGLTAIPDLELGGLLVQSVEPGSRAERGRLRSGDRILEINGTKLVGLSEGNVQDHLRRSVSASELRVRVIRGHSINGKYKKNTKISEMIEAEEKSSGAKVATVSPTRKLPGAQAVASLQVANTRKLGRRIEIILKKGAQGLGFSVTTRDNPAGGQCPIYIKNIMPRGAAIEDGQLKPGDRLLEVDGVPMTGKMQTEVVQALRSIQSGASVKIVVSRQQELAELEEREINFCEEQEDNSNVPPMPPAPIPPPTTQISILKTTKTAKPEEIPVQMNLRDKHFIDAGSESAASSDSLQTGIAWRNREVLTLHIPVHDTKRAGLGVEVKGKTASANSSNGSSNGLKHDGDLGIFVKKVIHGGAASRDGRLKTNDQFLSVNGVSLLGQTNAEAMETLSRVMVHTWGEHPDVITLSVARRISRPHSSGDLIDQQQDSSNASENSGATVIYLSPDKKDFKDNMNRWSNPVLDRLTGGVCSSNSANKRPSPLLTQGLRNESYYMATNDNWSPAINPMTHPGAINNSVLIEDDPEPVSPMIPNRPNDSVTSQPGNTSNPSFDATYASQLSLETNNSAEVFSRDAVGRRSISEKHHAALDARETGTYQRNKKMREEREKERRIQLTKSAIITSGSIESLARINSTTRNGSKSGSHDLKSEALDQVGDLGPTLGLKKSSSLESLLTMVQEIQMADEPRNAPSALRAPRGRGREDVLRAEVVGDADAKKPRKHWLLEEGDSDGGFVSRNGPLQSSLNDGKNKNRNKKPGLLKGIGHMFRFGKHRKDGVVPVETTSDFGGVSSSQSLHGNSAMQPQQQQSHHQQQQPHTLNQQKLTVNHQSLKDRPKGGPPIYQPPPPPIVGKGGVLHNEIFNHRYQHYVNYDDLQHQISPPNHQPPPPTQDELELSESTIEHMRRQVMRQRVKVEEERRHQHYHSQRSTRTTPETSQHQQGPMGRPISSYYEYETVQHNVGTNPNRKVSAPSPPRQWKAATLNGGPGQSSNPGGSGRSRGPFVTQVTIRDPGHMLALPSGGQSQHPVYHHQAGQQPHASKV